VPANQAIVGKYGFTHESGIHTYGVLNDPSTYEPYPPELVGNSRQLTIGKQSGKNVIKHKMVELTGTIPDSNAVAVVVDKVKAVYATGRRRSLKDWEFKRILEELTLPESNETSIRPECCLKVHI
jgi:isopropylmalate/homocitrate/citramalate synthase